MLEAITIARTLGRGLVRVSDLRDLGVTHRELARALSQGELVRVRRGFYACPPADRPFWPSELYALRVRATAEIGNPESVVSHLSAAALHGLPLIGRWPDAVHVRLPGAPGGSSSAGIVRHRSRWVERAEHNSGVRVTTVAQTLVDVASSASFLVGVTMLDHALRLDLATKEDVLTDFETGHQGAGARRLAAAVAFSDGRSGSAGESLSRVRMFQLKFQRPELQVHVSTTKGEHDVDFGWQSVKRFGEFDGYVKYTRDAYLKGRPIQDVVIAEKVREDAIRAKTGNSFLRWLWSDALDPVVFESMLREAGVPQDQRRR